MSLSAQALAQLGFTIAPAPGGGFVATLAGRGDWRGVGGQWGPFPTEEAALVGALQALLIRLDQQQALAAGYKGILASQGYHHCPGCGLFLPPGGACLCGGHNGGEAG